jgi:hypothetical protein
VGHEERDVWVAWFYDEGLGPTLNDLVRRRTAVGAALAAWESFGRERHAGGQAELGVPEA